MRAGATWGGGGTLHESLGSEAHRSNDIEVTRAERFPDSWKGRDTKIKICPHILTYRICHATSWGWACARSLCMLGGAQERPRNEWAMTSHYAIATGKSVWHKVMVKLLAQRIFQDC